MNKLFKRSWRIILVVCLALIVFATPVYAINNPDSLTIPYYQVFYNVLETGDMLITAESKLIYAVEPTDYTANQAFEFDLLNVSGTDLLASVALAAYGDRPIGIYLSATRVTTLALTVGTAYQLRIMGNPLIFPTQAGNTAFVTLDASDYTDQLLGVDGGVPSSNNLRNGMITIANSMETYDTPVDSYLVNVQGYTYLTSAGGDLFMAGIPALSTMCPILFATGVNAMDSQAPETTGTYASVVTPAQQWGSTVANGLTNLGIYLGISQALAGSVILLILAIMLGVYVYSKTESGITLILLIAVVPFVGAYLGLMPMALAFIFAIIIVVLVGYFFYARGAL